MKNTSESNRTLRTFGETNATKSNATKRLDSTNANQRNLSLSLSLRDF